MNPKITLVQRELPLQLSNYGVLWQSGVWQLIPSEFIQKRAFPV